MAESALTNIGGVVYNILYNSLSVVVVVALIVVLFFGWKYYQKWAQKKKSYKQLQGLIVKRDGTWFTDQLGYFNHADGIDKLHMKGTGHTLPVLPSNCVRGGKCILFNYAPKQYAAIPCNLWEKIDLKKFGIEVVNLQMKNFVFLEQRAAVSRWQYLKDMMAKWAPWITLVLVGTAVALMVWFLMKFGLNLWDNIVAARTMECKDLLPQLQNNIIVPKP